MRIACSISIYFLAVTISATNFKSLDTLIKSGIKQHVFPGAVAVIAHKGIIVYHKAFGHYTYDAASPRITTNTLFDVASLTKLMSATSAMILCDQQQLALNDPVGNYLPTFKAHGKKNIRIHHLLTHTSGLEDKAILASKPGDDLVAQICASNPAHQPGLKFLYNDSDMLILQAVVETISDQPFDLFTKEHIFDPLGMHSTQFNPHAKDLCAPTRISAHKRPYLLQGEVDDDRAFNAGGIAGHAGLFSTAHDFARYMLMLVHDGVQGHRQVIKPRTVQRWTTSQCDFTASDEKGNRGYGFEIGRHLSPTAFGHFGFTGTSVWADRDRDLVCILFTNRVQPQYDDGVKIKNFRIRFHSLILEIVTKK